MGNLILKLLSVRTLKLTLELELTLVLFLFLFFEGCSIYKPLRTEPAEIGAPTAVEKELGSLPAPKEPIVAAVYKFRDETGQYKLSTAGSSFSTAVTQGATTILIKALEDSHWFVPIEREGLSDLLNERKIIRSSRENFLGEDGKKLPERPPLLYAGVILEGGIVSYETNLITGGSGVKYFGSSASGQYREDRVTVYLRAVSTQNGRVLKTVYTTKTILSQMVDAGLFQFVDYQNLLEVETGYTYNEPVDFCVTEAIQKAVESLVIEGVEDGLWQLKYPQDMYSTSIIRYNKEKLQSGREDQLGNTVIEKRPLLGIDLSAGLQQYSGDYPDPLMKVFGGAGIKFNWDNNWSLGAAVRYGRLGAADAFDNLFGSLDLSAYYKLIPRYSLTPYLTLGGEIIYKKENGAKFPVQMNEANKYYFAVLSGVGLEYTINNTVGLSVELNNHYALSDELDGLSHGKLNDYFWAAKAGITIYIIQ